MAMILAIDRTAHDLSNYLSASTYEYPECLIVKGRNDRCTALALRLRAPSMPV